MTAAGESEPPGAEAALHVWLSGTAAGTPAWPSVPGGLHQVIQGSQLPLPTGDGPDLPARGRRSDAASVNNVSYSLLSPEENQSERVKNMTESIMHQVLGSVYSDLHSVNVSDMKQGRADDGRVGPSIHSVSVSEYNFTSSKDFGGLLSAGEMENGTNSSSEEDRANTFISVLMGSASPATDNGEANASKNSSAIIKEALSFTLEASEETLASAEDGGGLQRMIGGTEWPYLSALTHNLSYHHHPSVTTNLANVTNGRETLFADYPPHLLDFAVFCCVLFIVLGVPGNLITIIALVKCKKVIHTDVVGHHGSCHVDWCLWSAGAYVAGILGHLWSRPSDRFLHHLARQRRQLAQGVPLRLRLRVAVRSDLRVLRPHLLHRSPSGHEKPQSRPKVSQGERKAAQERASPCTADPPTLQTLHATPLHDRLQVETLVKLSTSSNSVKVEIVEPREEAQKDEEIKKEENGRGEHENQPATHTPSPEATPTGAAKGDNSFLKTEANGFSGHSSDEGVGVSAAACSPIRICPPSAPESPASVKSEMNTNSGLERRASTISGKGGTFSHLRGTFRRTRAGSFIARQPTLSAKDRRLLKMILVIFLSFVACYLPITLVKTFSKDDNPVLNILGLLLIYMTTCINPIIYVVMSSEYRQAYVSLLTCKRDHDPANRSITKIS
nr:uncharacterized protein LOC128685826 [Cherax quadricarinatus]